MRNGVLAGYHLIYGSFRTRESYATIWSSRNTGSSAWSRLLNYSNATEYRKTLDKSAGLSAIYKAKGEIT